LRAVLSLDRRGILILEPLRTKANPEQAGSLHRGEAAMIGGE
jgi:hypothetical protein